MKHFFTGLLIILYILFAVLVAIDFQAGVIIGIATLLLKSVYDDIVKKQ